MRNYTRREFTQLLKEEGYYPLKEGKGSHEIWYNGVNRISVPGLGKKTLSKGVMRQLINKYNLNIKK